MELVYRSMSLWVYKSIGLWGLWMISGLVELGGIRVPLPVENGDIYVGGKSC